MRPSEGVSNNRAGPVSVKLGEQAVEHKKDPNRVNPRTDDTPRRTAKKRTFFSKKEKEKDRKEKAIVLGEFWSQAGRPFRLIGWHLGELRQECDANPGE